MATTAAFLDVPPLEVAPSLEVLPSGVSGVWEWGSCGNWLRARAGPWKFPRKSLSWI